MTKKHEMSEHEYEFYKKQHAYEDVEAAEQGKIKREKAVFLKNRQKGAARLQQQLRNIAKPDDVEDVEEDLETPEEEQIAERVRRNARTHKKRLVGLRKHVNEDVPGADR